jgi:hypothetical protein
MAEILVKAVDANLADPETDLKASWKRGMPVVVKPDSHEWGALERLPNFVVLKFPLVPAGNLEKYVLPYDENNEPVRRRVWQVRWADLPLAARILLTTTGVLVIKATESYLGIFDYSWVEMRQYFRNLQTGLDETGDL